jgi:hypothetical protein
MKNILKLLVISSLLIAAMGACTKDENKIYYEGGTSPVLTSSLTGNKLPLSYANRDKDAIKLSWTNPNYQFTTGISSQDISYLLEIDTSGANFTNSKKQTVAVSKDLSKSFTQEEFNGYLLNQLALDTSVPHNIEIRVTSYLANRAVPLTSNVLKYVVVPYSIPPVVTPPAGGNLYLVGSATAGGWSNPVPTPGQQFKKISTTLYEITVPLIGGQEYLFLPLNGDWNHKYAVKDKTVAGLSDGGDFGFDKSDNFPGPAASGTYKIAVDFQRGKFTVTKQ